MKFKKQNVADISEESVEEYSIVVAKMLKFVNLSLELRCEDVVTRRDRNEMLKYER
jgi:hypothetical protein